MTAWRRGCSAVTRRSALALGALLVWAPLPQGPVLDSGTLVISRGGAVVGREEFTIRRGRSSGPEGFTIASSATYPPESPTITLSPVVELGADSLPVQVQFDVFGDGQARVYARFTPRRVTLRVVRPGGESARELPATGRLLVLDDSVFALYAIRPASGPIQTIAPRTGVRLPAELQEQGIESTTLQGVSHPLAHWVLRLGPEERHLWYDEAGRLMRVDVPALGLSAERASAAR